MYIGRSLGRLIPVFRNSTGTLVGLNRIRRLSEEKDAAILGRRGAASLLAIPRVDSWIEIQVPFVFGRS